MQWTLGPTSNESRLFGCLVLIAKVISRGKNAKQEMDV